MSTGLLCSSIHWVELVGLTWDHRQQLPAEPQSLVSAFRNLLVQGSSLFRAACAGPIEEPPLLPQSPLL